MKYRKKPVVVEATQWFENGDHPRVLRHFDSEYGYIDTLEGSHLVTPGDYIITGVKGEHYPCKPDIFAMTYEEALAQPAQRPWVGLTDDEIKAIIGSWGGTPIKGYTRKLFDQIEAKLKEKNHD